MRERSKLDSKLDFYLYLQVKNEYVYKYYECKFRVTFHFFFSLHDLLNRFYFLEIPSCVDQATTTILNASYSVQTFESHPEFSTSQNYNKCVLRSVFLQ